jgi:hypothetical protein
LAIDGARGLEFVVCRRFPTTATLRAAAKAKAAKKLTFLSLFFLAGGKSKCRVATSG